MMSEGQPEAKKSFAWIYISVAVFYAVMITVYGIVVHKATEDGARDPSVVGGDDTANDMPKGQMESNMLQILADAMTQAAPTLFTNA